MTLRKTGMALVGLAALVPLAFAGAASALTATCTGTAATSSVTWNASAADGVAPYAYLWGNGATSVSQTLAAAPGTHSMSLQVTDASSTVATTTCIATINQQGPTITSFTATPASITSGQSATLSWVVANASSTSLNNGIGAVSSTSVTVSPTVSTTYTLTATNPQGSVTANALVTVNATSTGGVSDKIQALLAQINALRAQIAQLLGQAGGSGGTATSTPAGCFGFWRDLKHGDIGDDVKALQQQLAHDDPTLFPPGLVTGFFGPKTEAALKMFQRRFGIDASGTGFFGMKSRGHFASLCSNGDSDKDGTSNRDDSDDDNDGTPDVEDKFPFNPNATSTSLKKWNDDMWKKGKDHADKAKKEKPEDDDDDENDD